MNFEEFQNKARLYVVGALDPEDFQEFELAKKQFGAEAGAFLQECERLNAIFALSLRPTPPHADTKMKLLEKIRGLR